jgi:hypothetical protein
MTYADDTFSKSYKDKYRQLVKQQFNLFLLNESEEAADITEARKRLNEATQSIRLKIKEGHLVSKQNIWYGFVRNLIGGTIYSTIFCIINIIVGSVWYRNPILVISSIILLVIYSIMLLFRRQILIQNAEAYANQLIAEFMAIDSN